MRVLITGGTGFVGSHTVGAVLAARHQVRLLARRPERVSPALAAHGRSAAEVEVAVGDVTDKAATRRALDGCDAVIHAGSAYALALPVWRSGALMTTNVQGTANVLRAAADLGLDPIVHVSSSWALVQPKPAVLTEETTPDHPPDPYPRSKVGAEHVARELQERGAPVVITYPGGVWGPDDPYWGETCQFAESVLRGQLRVVPRGTAPFSDVREVARLHAAVLTPGSGPRRYLVPSHSPTMPEVIAAVAAAAGRSLPCTELPGAMVIASLLPLHWLQAVSPLRLPLPYAGPWYVTRRNVYGESRATREFGIQARPFTESVRDTIEWMRGTGRLPASLIGPATRSA